MSDTKKIAYNTIVQIVARVVTTLASLVAIMYLTRYLGVEGFGQYTMIIAYLALFGIFADFGFFLLQVREVTQKPEQERYIVGNIFGLKLALCIGVFAVAYLASLFIYDNPVVTTGILIGGLMQSSIILAQVPVSIFQARLEMDRVALTNVLARIVYLGLVLWAVKQDMGLIGIMWISVAANVFAFAIQTIWVWRVSPIIPQWDFKYWKNFLVEAWPIGIVVILATIYFRIDTVMLSLMKGEWEVGIYGAPYKITEVVLTVPTIFMTSVFPVITKALDNNLARAQTIFKKAFDSMALLAAPLAFGVTIIGTPLMVMISGQDFAASGPALKLLIWAVAISYLGGVLNYSIVAAGKQRILVWPYLIATLFNVVTNLIVIPRYSYMGAAAVTVATELLVFILVLAAVYRIFKLFPGWSVFLKSLAGSVIMFAVLWWVNSDSIWINAVLGAAVYAVVIIVTKAVDKNIVRELLKPG